MHSLIHSRDNHAASGLSTGTAAKIRHWFLTYTRAFKARGADHLGHVTLKEEHSLRVSRLMVELGAELGLDDRGICLSEVMGILHDVGRFEQYAAYHTFSDARSIDHGRLGADIVEHEGILSPFGRGIEELVLKTIRLHNRAALPPMMEERLLFFSRLVRDADKLDILDLFIQYFSGRGDDGEVLDPGLTDTAGVSPGVLRDLDRGEIVDARRVKNLNDFKLLKLGWIYDINFRPTLERVADRGYIARIEESLAHSAPARARCRRARSYLRGKSRNNP